MAKFKVGDIVKAKKGGWYHADPEKYLSNQLADFPSENYIYATGELGKSVSEVRYSENNHVYFYRAGCANWCTETGLELAEKAREEQILNNQNKPTIMTKLTSAFKKFLSPSLKAQVEAGFRGSDLELTSSGNSILLEIIAEKFEEEFTAKAKELIKENKEASK